MKIIRSRFLDVVVASSCSDFPDTGQIIGSGGTLSRMFFISEDYKLQATWSLSREEVKRFPALSHGQWLLTESGRVYTPRAYGQGPSITWPKLRKNLKPFVALMKEHAPTFAAGFLGYYAQLTLAEKTVTL